MKKLQLAAAIGALFSSACLVSSAHAGTNPINFNTQTNGTISVSTFDWSPDNALAVGATPISTDPLHPTTFNLYAQASLGNFLDASNNVITGTGLNSKYQITFQAGFTETGFVDAFGTAHFALAASPTVDFFNVYYSTTLAADPLTGLGYNAGTQIMQATVVNNKTVFSLDFNPDGSPVIVPLDNFGANNYPTVGTVSGSGGGSIGGAVATDLASYFPGDDFSTFVIDLLFNTSNITPFSQVNPSAQVVGNTPVYGDPIGVYTGGVNGLGVGQACTTGGCDFQFQSDANQSFYSVPEPGTLALLGLGLSALGFTARRRRA